ncbi:MAG: penicillin-binding protein [Phenylobacterium sp. RIFCSPHIGHO2_01_FULL_69_31]|jgi:cell division protein FtsI (penicillin-binding protein 3)|uniref:peptidoglycan D,D-transpeptidase FtsI family protein n=1 Tax=Phenylobacterium sp. RIFCSPHIGHO2_01_FULL_69_31 TaxID=1801944 RepID=UPI0008C491DC|nr:penicillin-binding protein 2 [Phenylobacterium sp. RIFCSPHIGHO2_01_FULL_69_31]OHB31806.1 MAG: penicillin-binding protein [Phenylobacterium sp. RIFCSPHIGHO2_01_FULL_69_31]
MSFSQQAFGRTGLPRWLIERVWGLEHAFERARASGKAEDDTRLRIFFVLALFTLGFITLAIGATRAALFSDVRSGGSLAALGASRADLVDRNGMLLAADLLHYGLYIDPREIWETEETRRSLLRTLPNLEPERLERALRGNRRIFVLGALTPQERNRVHELGLPGVSFEPEQRRVYPLGTSAAHIVGFSDAGGEGISGAEAAFNDDIRAAARNGAPVPLSIDLRVQGALEDELYKAVAEFTPKGAVGLVTDVHTGEILGMASWPAFDPNKPGKAGVYAQTNRAAATVYEMGSTFKAFTVAIGLDSGVATPESTFDARNPYKLGYRTIHDYHAARKVLTLVEVFQHSSNIGTAKLAESVGPQQMGRYFAGLGLTTPAKVELVESARPLTPKVWNDDAVASTSFGHGINVTPLALARAYGTILNGGKLIPLTIRKLEPGAKVDGPRVMSERTSLQMLSIMRANVSGESGSGRSANMPGLSVGGKTGTGEKYDPAIRGYSRSRQVSSFAAVFPTTGPVDAKRYFVLILLDEPHGTARSAGYSTGGWVAAPAAGRVIERIAPFLGVTRRADVGQAIPVEPPSVEQMGEGQ